MTAPYNERTRFRLFSMPCCKHQLCWLNPRDPAYCPECGASVLVQIKTGAHTLIDEEAWLRVGPTKKEPPTDETAQRSAGHIHLAGPTGPSPTGREHPDTQDHREGVASDDERPDPPPLLGHEEGGARVRRTSSEEPGRAAGVNTATVHILHNGRPLCRFSMSVPGDWPPNHRWVGWDDAQLANCPGCQHTLTHPEAAPPRPAPIEAKTICELQILRDEAGLWLRLCADGLELERWGPYHNYDDVIQASRAGAAVMREAVAKQKEKHTEEVHPRAP